MEYRYNRNNVCLNPEEIKIDDYVVIKLSSRLNHWYSGHYYEYMTTFGTSPCVEAPSLRHDSRIDALKFEVKKMINYLENQLKVYHNHNEYNADVKRIKASIRHLKEYLFNITHVQLSLFDDEN